MAHVAQEMYFDLPVPSGVLPIVFLIFPDPSDLLPSPWRSSRVHWVSIEGGSLRGEPRFLMEAGCRPSPEPSGLMTPKVLVGPSKQTMKTIQSRKSFWHL